MVYIAYAKEFSYRHPYPMLDWLDAEIEEWGSVKAVTPLVRLLVKPDDFPYLEKVQYRL
jgi:hypothetical protein